LAGLNDVSIEAIEEAGVCRDRTLDRVIRNLRRTLRGNDDHEGRGTWKDFKDVPSPAANGLKAIMIAHSRVDGVDGCAARRGAVVRW
jgi:hypothetical protein